MKPRENYNFDRSNKVNRACCLFGCEDNYLFD